MLSALVVEYCPELVVNFYLMSGPRNGAAHTDQWERALAQESSSRFGAQHPANMVSSRAGLWASATVPKKYMQHGARRASYRNVVLIL